MAALTSVITPSLKRKEEIQEGNAPKRVSPEPVEEFDLYPLFLTILDNMSPSDDGPQDSKLVASNLLQVPDILLPLHLVPINKIVSKFKEYLISVETTEANKKGIFTVLSDLYQVSMQNSSTKEYLSRTAKELPSKIHMLEGNAKQKIEALLGQTTELLNKEPGPHLLVRIDKLMTDLNVYRDLLEFTDTSENHRMRHLAKALKEKDAQVQYTQFLSDYPHLVKQIEMLSKEIESVAKAIAKLNALQLKLRQDQKSPLPEDPIKVRFINPFGTPFYNAFAEHLWTLLWNSRRDPELKSAVGHIPAVQTLKRESIDFVFLNELWGNYYPDHDYLDWMLISLKNLSMPELEKLEQHLQECDKQLNLNQRNSKLSNAEKADVKLAIQFKMKALCKAIISPSADLNSLKKYLQNHSKKETE